MGNLFETFLWFFSFMRYIGVVRGNRIAKCPFAKDKLLKERGEFDYFSNVDCLFVKWKDNNRVICGTNFSSIEPLHKVKRLSLIHI